MNYLVAELRGIKTQVKPASYRLPYAASCGESDPKRLNRGRYNQIANYALTQTEIHIAIGDKPPEAYFKQIVEQCNSGKKKFGGITDIAELSANFAENCIPQSMMSTIAPNYDAFLDERRELMAAKLKAYFQAL